MKAINGEGYFLYQFNRMFARALIVAGFLFGMLPLVHASMIPGEGPSGPSYKSLGSWSFIDHTNWTSDLGYAPVSFTNLTRSYLGNGNSLVVNDTNGAWLQYNVFEGDGKTNLAVNKGSVTFWFAANWSSTNLGGTGPGEWSRLLEVGSYTPDSSYGWWSLYVDPEGNNLYFSAQTNDLSSNVCNYLSVPIAWTTNYFHYIALTYSPTNTTLYLDGELATNGPPMTNYPGLDVLTNGFYIGSASNGVSQANGMFNSLYTYDVPMDANTIQGSFKVNYSWYLISPWNTAMAKFNSAPSSPSVSPTFKAITGAGYLQWNGTASFCDTSTNVWLTNIVASMAGNGTMNVTFTIEGGQDYLFYDVFAAEYLTIPITNCMWSWMGQGYHCNTYTITNLSSANAFLILGTPLDSDGDGLTDAYENLVSHTDPNNPDSSGDGMLDGWKAMWGLNGMLNNPTQSNLRNNFTYDLSGWLQAITGVRSETVTSDAEGNIQQNSQ